MTDKIFIEKKIYYLSTYIALLSVLLMYALLQEYYSFFIWLFFYFFGRRVCSFVDHCSCFRRLYDMAYFIISFVGLIVVFDNNKNFGTYFGKGIDDYRYFKNISMIEGGGGFFEIILAPVYSSIALFKASGEVNLVDILPINWLAASIVVVVVAKFIVMIGFQIKSVTLFLSSILLSYNFIDNAVRLYRDVWVVLFMVIAIIAIYERKKIAFALFSILTGLMRGANFMLLIVFYFINNIFAGNKKVVYIAAFMTFSAFSYVAIDKVVVYSTAFDRVDKIQEYLSKSGSGNDAFRYLEVRGEVVSRDNYMRSNYLSGALSEGGVKSFLVKVFAMVFYPLTIHSPYKYQEINADFAEVNSVKGFFLYEVIKIFFVLSWSIYLPYLILGLWVGFFKERKILLSIVVFLFIILLTFSYASGQSRHLMILVALYPVITIVGYDYSKKSEFSNYMFFSQVFVFVLIILWNIYRWL